MSDSESRNEPAQKPDQVLLGPISLRDWFAEQALQALILGTASPTFERGKVEDGPDWGFSSMKEFGPGSKIEGFYQSFAEIAAWEAYGYVDAMLEERNRGHGK